jgi:hypothetical protein
MRQCQTDINIFIIIIVVVVIVIIIITIISVIIIIIKYHNFRKVNRSRSLTDAAVIETATYAAGPHLRVLDAPGISPCWLLHDNYLLLLHHSHDCSASDRFLHTPLRHSTSTYVRHTYGNNRKK